MTNISPYYIESLKKTRVDYLPQLLEALVAKDYSIIERKDWEYDVFLLIESDNIRGQIYEGRVHLDNKEVYGKPRNCFFQLPIPTSQQQVNFILEQLDWLTTKESKEYSDNFNYIEEYE